MSETKTVRVIRCACGGTPDILTERGGEDFMEAWLACPRCHSESPRVEHVWGGEEMRAMAVDEWNRMQREARESMARVSPGAADGRGMPVETT